jgi:amino acid adenylation domain-containing protein
MSNAAELLKQLRSLGVQLRLEGETLRLNAPKGALTPELQAELKVNKSEILALLQAMQQSGGNIGAASIKRVERHARMPLSFAQQRLWFLQQMDPLSPAYNIVAFLHLKGELNVEILERSLYEIVQRHEGIRTIFGQEEGTPYSTVADSKDWKLETAVLQRNEGERLEDAAFRFSEQRARDLFNLETAPLFRSFLMPVDEDEHLLFLAIHHIISDGWSLGVMVRELAENYRAYSHHQTPRLTNLPVQYLDYAEWQRNWLNSGVLERQLQYWRKQLDGAPAVSIFPPDHPRSPDGSNRGKRRKMKIPAELTSQIEVFSRGQGATLFMTMLAAFQLMLSRYSGQREVVVGSPSANRNHAELSDLVGFFVNNLVLRVEVAEGITFLDLLKRVKETTLGAFENQDAPFDQLVRGLQFDRSAEYSPLFQTMFILQNFPVEELILPNVTVTPLETEGSIARFDLTVEVYPLRKELVVFFDYRADLYEEETILNLQQSFVHILQSVVEAPHQLVDKVPLIAQHAREHILRSALPSYVDARPALLLQSFDYFSKSTVDKVAVSDGTDELTYAQLQARVNRLAQRLEHAGIASGSLVPVCLYRSTDLLVALLAVLRSGAAYVPLDPIYPAQRIAMILEDVQPDAILSETPLLPLLGSYDARVVLMDEGHRSDFEEYSEEISSSTIAPQADDLAYVIFTSGSTGRPKGVEITHGALANFLESMRITPGFTSEDRLLAVTTVSFDIAGLELFLPIYAGGEVAIASAPGDLPLLLADLERVQPTVLQATPALWQMLISSGWHGSPTLKALCGGEALTAQLAQALLPNVQELWNMYGPTETTIWSAVLQIHSASGSSIPVGGPIRNTSFYVLDAQREPVPIGVAGELYIGGDSVARGYLHRAELTAERFIADPFGGGGRLYRTGDLVRRRLNGTLEFLGRADFQVKLRGFRIELGEIEHAIRQQPEVSESVVLLREHRGQNELAAYVVLRPNQHLSVSTLRQRLRERIPEYMIPAVAVFLDAFPRLPNGKLDRSKLPAPALDNGEEESALQTDATTPAEVAIATVFRDLLHTERIGVEQRFFDLGAHSLLLVKAHDRIRRELDPDLRLVSLFQYPSVSALAAHIDENLKRAAEVVHGGD